MAQLLQAIQNEIGFRSVQLLKTQSLGIGSYGAVCKAKCDDLLCAAKIIHPTLVDPTARALVTRQTEHRLPISRFEQECQFLSSIHHPKIVQYLGTHQDPENGLPVLLMELMDESLTSFLKRCQQELPYHIQVTISLDIALALSFLHSNRIIHRDLSSNNVLMIGNSRAKVTDFGMAKLAGTNPQATRVSVTQTPGADVYMSPEATQIPPVYTEKIDCFSHGVLGVQIMTRQFPNPGKRFNRIQIQDPRFPRGIEARVAEVERRQEHISLINQTHPLLAVALDCLKDEEGERPSAREICGSLVALKQAPQFTQSVREQATPQQSAADEGAVRELQQELQQLQQQLDRELSNKDQEIARTISSKDREIAAKDHEIQQIGHDLQTRTQEKDSLLEDSEQLRQENERITAEFQQASLRDERRIHELEQLLKLESTQPETSSGGAEGPVNIELKWREGKKALYKYPNGGPDAVVDGSMVYLNCKGYGQVQGYDSTTNDWFQLPNCPHYYFSLAVVDNLLTAIGGNQPTNTLTGTFTNTPTNTLLSLIVEGQNKQWMENFHPMPTKRFYTCAVSSVTALIVIGGTGERGVVLSTVEVMDTNTKHWTTAASLPEALSSASATICGNRIYVLGAVNISGDQGAVNSSVFTCSLSALLQSCQPKPVVQSVSQTDSTSVWSKVADLPVIQSTCVTFQGRLLAIGGDDSDHNSTAAVRMYDLETDSWSVISHMTTPRRQCFAAVLPENKLLVIGGDTGQYYYNSQTDSVEIGYI